MKVAHLKCRILVPQRRPRVPAHTLAPARVLRAGARQASRVCFWGLRHQVVHLITAIQDGFGFGVGGGHTYSRERGRNDAEDAAATRFFAFAGRGHRQFTRCGSTRGSFLSQQRRRSGGPLHPSARARINRCICSPRSNSVHYQIVTLLGCTQASSSAKERGPKDRTNGDATRSR